MIDNIDLWIILGAIFLAFILISTIFFLWLSWIRKQFLSNEKITEILIDVKKSHDMIIANQSYFKERYEDLLQNYFEKNI